jgi:hypothetical protein
MAIEPEPEPLDISRVEDHEVLRRAVKDDPTHFACDANGALVHLGQSAFNDPEKRPSVDRAALQPDGAHVARRADTDGVVSLVASDVRNIAGVSTFNDKGKIVQGHEVDVRHDPLNNNRAHALVVTAPQITSDGTFKRLKA